MLYTAAVLSVLIGSAAIGPDVVQAGALKLCRPTVETAVIREDANTGKRSLHVTLDGQARATFADITRQAVGTPLPVTLNGIVVFNPYIHEEIIGGEFEIPVRDERDLERIKVALLSDC